MSPVEPLTTAVREVIVTHDDNPIPLFAVKAGYLITETEYNHGAKRMTIRVEATDKQFKDEAKWTVRPTALVPHDSSAGRWCPCADCVRRYWDQQPHDEATEAHTEAARLLEALVELSAATWVLTRRLRGVRDLPGPVDAAWKRTMEATRSARQVASEARQEED